MIEKVARESRLSMMEHNIDTCLTVILRVDTPGVGRARDWVRVKMEGRSEWADHGVEQLCNHVIEYRSCMCTASTAKCKAENGTVCLCFS